MSRIWRESISQWHFGVVFGEWKSALIARQHLTSSCCSYPFLLVFKNWSRRAAPFSLISMNVWPARDVCDCDGLGMACGTWLPMQMINEHEGRRRQETETVELGACLFMTASTTTLKRIISCLSSQTCSFFLFFSFYNQSYRLTHETTIAFL